MLSIEEGYNGSQRTHTLAPAATLVAKNGVEKYDLFAEIH